MQVGDSCDQRTQMGPLITPAHRASIERFVALGLAEGGRLLYGGARPAAAALGQGNYYLPTIFEGLPNRGQLCQQEVFGPVLVALPFDDEDDLVRQVNDSVHALAAGIWSRDFKTAWRRPAGCRPAPCGSTPTSCSPPPRPLAAGATAA